MAKRPDNVISIDGDDPYWLRSKLPGAQVALKKLRGGNKAKGNATIKFVKKDNDE